MCDSHSYSDWKKALKQNPQRGVLGWEKVAGTREKTSPVILEQMEHTLAT
jgi:hypothetical protein